MFRRTVVALAVLSLAAPLYAQDHDKRVEGAGALPKGWSGRTDDPSEKVENVKFVTMGSGWHVTSGPAAIYWNDQVAKGPFTANVTIRQTKAPEHPEAYGIFFMGKDLNSPQQNYAYFIVRGDGKYMVNHRAGADVHKIVPWTDSPAVNKADANGKATNKLTVDATKPDSVRLLVNDKQVAALPMSHLGKTDGIVGVRVNHNLDVHIGDLTVTPKK
jgi:hypothetical protein